MNAREQIAVIRGHLQTYLEQGNTQVAIARQAGLSQSVISRVLSGAAERLTPSTAIKLARALEIPLAALGLVAAADADVDQLQPESIRWALRNIEKFGASDLLPPPFEHPLLQKDADFVVRQIEALDLSRHQPRPAQTYLLPKPDGDYRLASLLDPIDHVLYTAIAYELAPLIEEARAPAEIATTYRVDLSNEASLFQDADPWPGFNERTVELFGALGDDAHWIETDIVQFYSQIQHRTLTRNLLEVGIDELRVRNLMRLFDGWTPTPGRGIPIGPNPSNLFAEVAMVEVDAFLSLRGCSFVRYSDDVRIFVSGQREAFEVHYQLARFLDTQLGLLLNPSKTAMRTDVEGVIRTHGGDYADLVAPEPMGIAEPEPRTPADEDDVIGGVVDTMINQHQKGVVDEVLEAGTLAKRRGEVRSAFRHCNGVELVAAAMANLDALTPVLRQVSHYLSSRISDKLDQRPRVRTRLAELLVEYAETGPRACIPGVQLELLHLLTSSLADVAGPKLLRLCEAARTFELGLRPRAALARALRDRAWVRSHRTLPADPWDRRAVLWASSVLDHRERDHFRQEAMDSDDLLDRIVGRALEEASA